MKKSPCLLTCSRNPEGGCNDCYRTKEELTRWSEKSPEERDAIWWRLMTQTPYLFRKLWNTICWIITIPFAALFLLIVLAGLPLRSVWGIILLPAQVLWSRLRR